MILSDGNHSLEGVPPPQENLELSSHMPPSLLGPKIILTWKPQKYTLMMPVESNTILGRLNIISHF